MQLNPFKSFHVYILIFSNESDIARSSSTISAHHGTAKLEQEIPQTLQIPGKTIFIPPRTGIMPSILEIQMHPKYWEDPSLWKPSRWIKSTPGPSPQTSTLSSENEWGDWDYEEEKKV